jgi:biotin transport system ATP-binding protein
MIDVDAVTYRHDDARAVDDVSLTVDDGEFVLLVGPNGAGKTTLLDLLGGLREPDTGVVRIDGTPTTADPVAARSAVGTVFQDPADGLVAATVGADVAFGPENLGLARPAVERRVADALAAVGMDGRAAERIDRLSGGERARVALAGALATEPDHLVLDEPLDGLDWPATRRLLGRLDDRRASGVSLVVAAHDLRDLAPRADRVVALSGGRVVHETTDPDPDRLREYGVRPW